MLSYKDYKKALNIKGLRFSYNFLHGEIAEDDDRNDIETEYKYRYESIHEFLVRFTEIFISEYSLNEFIWCNSAFEGYHYDKLRISMKNKKGKRKKYRLDEFMKSINILSDPIKFKEHIYFNGNRYTVTQKLDNFQGDRNFLHLYSNVFVELDEGVNKIKEIKRKSKLLINDFDEWCEWARVYTGSKVNQSIAGLRALYEIPMDHFILSEATSKDCVTVKIKEKIKIKVKGKKEWKTVKDYTKLRNKCFKVKGGR
jgi:hypothetical protein